MNQVLAMIRQALEPCRIPAPVPLPVPVRRPRFQRVIAAASILVSLASASLTTGAHAWPAPARDEVNGNLVDVQVLVDGWPVPLYARPGAWDKSYFQAFRGRNYSLVMKNQSNDRVGIVISVDGLNVVNGQRSELSNHEGMYVLDPYESATIQGWRTSLHDVRRFVFVDEERSYASRTDQANGDMGWIRVLSFRERHERVTWREDRPWLRGGSDPDGAKSRREFDAPRDRSEEGEGRRDGAGESRGNAAPTPPATEAPGRSGDLRAQKLGGELHSAPQSDAAPGTGWGDQRFDPVRETQFFAAASPSDHIVLRYEYASGLAELGIYPRHRRVFQRERGELGFAAPPRR